MIVGDLVNSASRLQGSAAPGTVYVGEATQRITSGAIHYESAGLIEVKGKSEPIAAFRGLADLTVGHPGRYAEAFVTLLRGALAALGGDREGAVGQFRIDIAEMVRVAQGMHLATARAVFALRVGPDHPEAAAAGAEARAWFEQVGAEQMLRIFADGFPASERVAATGS